MFIYTVQPGDSLFSISANFQVPQDMIRSVNGLAEPGIVPGQALLIVSDTYIIQPGDSFYTVSEKSFIPVNLLLEANPEIDPDSLEPGMQIRLPELPGFNASTFSYFYVTGTPADQLLVRDFAPYTTYYSFFDYQFFSDGSLSLLDDLGAIEAAWNSNTLPLATITNLTPAGFSPELTSIVLNNPFTRQNLIQNITQLVSDRGYAGVNIDFEGTHAADRDIFSTFLNELGTIFRDRGLLLTIAVHPKTSDAIPWLAGYDYGAIGAVVDFMFIMAYDWHHLDSGPGPVAPLNEVRSTIEYALEHVNRNKIILGVPLYGYDWTLPYEPGSPVRALSNQNAVELAIRHGSEIQYSSADHSPYFFYTDDLGREHVVWFEDPRSIAEKFSLVREYSLLGTGAWQIGLGFPQGPWLLTHFFNIRRA